MHAYDPILIGLRPRAAARLARSMTLAGRSGTTWLVWAAGCVYGNSYMTSGQQLVTVFGSYLEEVAAKCLVLPFFPLARYVYVMADALFLNELLPFGSIYCPL